MATQGERYFSMYLSPAGMPVRGWSQDDKAECVKEEDWMRRAGHGKPVSRIHVRLKPEGAPRRYATITEQNAWEIDPVGSRHIAQQGNSLRYSAGSGFYVADYSLLKTEESAS